MFLNPFSRRSNPFALVVGMTGVKMGDRLVQVGCADAARLAAIAGKVGLSGRAAAVVADQATGARVEKAASHAGVLVEVTSRRRRGCQWTTRTFDLTIIDDTGGALHRDERRAARRHRA